MLKAGRDNKLRAYLVARAGTLAPDSVDEAALLSEVSARELKTNAAKFWSLTEQGALCYRTKKYKEAARLFEQSLEAEGKPGAAVLNWLWLALAHHQLGEADEARRWLDKAAWLDVLGSELPANADAFTLHRHNWLEAHILRQEADGCCHRLRAKTRLFASEREGMKVDNSVPSAALPWLGALIVARLRSAG
jgi:tetratricopeptide (TPR) repeat protein